MSFIFILIGSMLTLDAIWWWLLARLLDRADLRIALGVFMAAQIIGLIGIISSRLLRADWDRWLPKFTVSTIFIWHFIVLGLLVVIGAALIPIFLIKTTVRWVKRDQPSLHAPVRRSNGWSRREFIRTTAAFAPPLFTLGLTGLALSQLNHFRVRRFVLPIRDLPTDLDGVTIAHVSDMHVGRFTNGQVLNQLVTAVNDLQADLVLVTGDLINDALADLDRGIELVRGMQGRFGLYMIEGNHDLIENGAEFERRVRQSGIPFLLDESAIVEVRGTPVQLLGLSWTRGYQNHDAAIAQAVRDLLQQRRADLFPILLAHHPHAFDAAVEAKMPLILSGHTHGGQLMLNDHIGGGPAIFKYWSGLYTQNESQMIVSNGVGNWFPLRVNAPAELIHITLHRLA